MYILFLYVKCIQIKRVGLLGMLCDNLIFTLNAAIQKLQCYGVTAFMG